MTDIPDIYSAPMIRALIREAEHPGTGKTMTRRLAWRSAKPAAKASFLRDGQWIASTPWQRVKPGDRLWVRECGAFACRRAPIYRADGEQGGWKWAPSIHMPRWASRLTLIVTATKIERLQEITNPECIAEGAEVHHLGFDGQPMVEVAVGYHYETARLWFHRLWDGLHGPDSWDANPEVVALTFRVVKANIDSPPKDEAA